MLDIQRNDFGISGGLRTILLAGDHVICHRIRFENNMKLNDYFISLHLQHQ